MTKETENGMFIFKLIKLDFKEQYRQQILDPNYGFMSATKREGQWLNSSENPYSKQYMKLIPTKNKLVFEKHKKIDEYRDRVKIK